jgi:ubiquitin conjugation factor E4 B
MGHPHTSTHQVDYETQSTDSFMANWSSVLIRLAEPFMDAKYTKVGIVVSKRVISADSLFQLDKIDPQYYLHSSRINVKDETRIKANAQEIEEWQEIAAQNRTLLLPSSNHE